MDLVSEHLRVQDFFTVFLRNSMNKFDFNFISNFLFLRLNLYSRLLMTMFSKILAITQVFES